MTTAVLPMGTLYNGDCLHIMPDLEPVDLVVTDPPYGIALHAQRKQWGTIDGDAGLEWLPEWARLLSRIARGPVYCFASWRTQAAFQAAGLQVYNCLVWDKAVFGIGWNWRPQYELILLAGKARGLKLDRHDRSNILRHKRIPSQRLTHVAEKPVALLQDLIEMTSSPGATVLDCFAGSGSTLEAAQLSGRRWIGIERDQSHYTGAVARMTGLSC